MTPVERVPYDTARAFERALTDRIAGSSTILPYSVPQLRRQFAYGRMLARVFLSQPSRWVLQAAKARRQGPLATRSRVARAIRRYQRFGGPRGIGANYLD